MYAFVNFLGTLFVMGALLLLDVELNWRSAGAILLIVLAMRTTCELHDLDKRRDEKKNMRVVAGGTAPDLETARRRLLQYLEIHTGDENRVSASLHEEESGSWKWSVSRDKKSLAKESQS